MEIITRLHPGANTDLVALSQDANAWGAVTRSVEAFFEPDFELEVISPLGGDTYTGLSGLRAFWLDWLAPWETYREELVDALDLGDKVLLLGRHHGTREKTGAEVTGDFAGLYTLRNGKVSRVQFYADQHEALKAVGWEE